MLNSQAPNEEMMNGNHAEDEKKNKKNKTKTKRNPDEKLEEISECSFLSIITRVLQRPFFLETT